MERSPNLNLGGHHEPSPEAPPHSTTPPESWCFRPFDGGGVILDKTRVIPRMHDDGAAVE